MIRNILKSTLICIIMFNIILGQIVDIDTESIKETQGTRNEEQALQNSQSISSEDQELRFLQPVVCPFQVCTENKDCHNSPCGANSFCRASKAFGGGRCEYI